MQILISRRAMSTSSGIFSTGVAATSYSMVKRTVFLTRLNIQNSPSVHQFSSHFDHFFPRISATALKWSRDGRKILSGRFERLPDEGVCMALIFPDGLS